jgi:hypothetical protein
VLKKWCNVQGDRIVQIKVGTALVEQKSVQIGRTCNQTGVQSDRTYCIIPY